MKMKIALLLAVALFGSVPAALPALAQGTASTDYAVGPQYDTTHVYVPQEQYDAFMKSFVATFGGKLSAQGQFQVTPTPSKTKSQLALTPAGTVSGFGFLTPIPYPFGHERNGYLVTDMDAAVASAVKHGAVRLIATFPDPIGRDVVVQWPGGVNMQLYWHTTKPNYAPLTTVPENRIYLTADAANAFLKSWRGYAHAKVIEDKSTADGADIGEPGKTYRQVRLTSGYGDMLVMVSDGQIPWPYGHEITGYAVANLSETLARASAAGVETLVPAHVAGDRQSAMVRFPGGYIAEIHAPTAH
ncbi:MAG TPA: glyoxalase [Sphingobium sp.]